MWFMSEKHTVRVQLACARILRRSSISARDWSRCYEEMSQWGGDVRIGTCSSLGWSWNPRFADERHALTPRCGPHIDAVYAATGVGITFLPGLLRGSSSHKSCLSAAANQSIAEARRAQRKPPSNRNSRPRGSLLTRAGDGLPKQRKPSGETLRPSKC